MKIAIINTTLAQGSKTLALAQCAAADVTANGNEPDLIDLANLSLPHCDGRTCYADPTVQATTARLSEASAILLCSPIYNYHLNAAAKNFLELTNNAWPDKVVGIICAAGSEKSYLAPMSFMTGLMADHRCLVVPRFVFATKAAFGPENTVLDENPVRGRIRWLVGEMARLAKAHKPLAKDF